MSQAASSRTAKGAVVDFEKGNCGVGFVVNLKGCASRQVVERGIRALSNLMHRGATGGDARTGDGAGIMIQIPGAFFSSYLRGAGSLPPGEFRPGIGMFFMPADPGKAGRCRKIVDEISPAEGLPRPIWREVPVNPGILGPEAAENRPAIWQGIFALPPAGGEANELKLYKLRKGVESEARKNGLGENDFYVVSLSSRLLVYKGLLTAAQLPLFFPDLADPLVESALAAVHQRFSTNTRPSWRLSQPFRHIAHNGEINTLRGNIAQMKAREQSMDGNSLTGEMRALLPVIDATGSDSSCLDNTLELLVRGGRTLPHAAMMLMPEAWGAKYPIGPDQRGFFEYHSGLMEPWDGPAAVVFCDGLRVGAILDRNGLRPARYTVCRDGTMVFASETGVLDFDAGQIVEKGSLRPGQILMADLEQKRLLKNGEIKGYYSRRQPYRRWVEENKIALHGFFGAVDPVEPDFETLHFRQRLFGYTREDLRVILDPMASSGREPVGSMGNDAPPALFSKQPQLFYNYFRQMFAQVTNPPMDPIREDLVMSLMTFIGNRAGILSETPRNSRLIKLRHPFLSNEDLRLIRNLRLDDFSAVTLKISFPAGGKGKDLEGALEALCLAAEGAARENRRLIILSDRGLEDNEAPIPALLAVSAVNQRLTAGGLRTGAGLILETGEAREVMHFALLLGFGATAVNPYLAFETVAAMALKKELDKPSGVTQAMDNYIAALSKGLLKIMSKMGICTLRSYRGAQVFEAFGIGRGLAEKYLGGIPSRLGVIGLDRVASDANRRHVEALSERANGGMLLPSGGLYQLRADGEKHFWTPAAIAKLQQATRKNDYGLFGEYCRMSDDQAEQVFTLRGLLKFKKAKPVPLEEVEPAESIVKRFVTGAMSFGSISKEAHETIALAMNSLQARSNCGEGGEDPARYRRAEGGPNLCSAIKQVASGRFGVSAEYLVNASDLQIKIAQGAKPGEGGQLPGHKVNAEIARVRHSTPGVTLISPPPHHDIYSIEDLSQLIYDLKNVNPAARISVKLVSELGVGTIAAGVAKAKADVIVISGGDGGTGASPLSSIKYAGMPWEIGLAEARRILAENNLRDRVRLQVDGQMRTGRDVVIAALLGAEEYGFATAALVVCGCVMMRRCQGNACPAGIATQDPRLRKFFGGRPEHLVNFFMMVARQTREILAQIGLRSLDEAIGRPDLLETDNGISTGNDSELEALLRDNDRHPENISRRCTRSQDHKLEDAFDRNIIAMVEPRLKSGLPFAADFPIRNIHRSAGAMLAGRVAREFGNGGLAADAITCRFSGSAGQSFGAFAVSGMTLFLNGDANDYVGKSLSGGKIIIRPPAGAAFDPAANIIAGNTILYGAVAGEVYISGAAGERFAVRNSGATAVVEGVGDHGCEYMTGGRVVVLGDTGINFAAGMSGGLAYVFDINRRFDINCNLDTVDLESLTDPADIGELRGLIENHWRYTGSPRAADILESWEARLPYFVKVFPMEYRRALGRMSREDESTEREEPVHG